MWCLNVFNMEITYEQAKIVVDRNAVEISETNHYSVKLDDEYFYFCPKQPCNFRYIQSGSNYCPNCGVKLNWIK